MHLVAVRCVAPVLRSTRTALSLLGWKPLTATLNRVPSAHAAVLNVPKCDVGPPRRADTG
ncbi:hypothetical protein [Aeromicrobium wangtongii]|uniref:hypothetical protein n=1 Tax=Aeromicrobium wangtongii TaxID=2969247 RepID=UPI002016F4EE|nr:hypothetical protein [Aeromicrobium wangtongii]MCL3818831.1 hypothetical protein [Aeromicrobium wangtongii]